MCVKPYFACIQPVGFALVSFVKGVFLVVKRVKLTIDKSLTPWLFLCNVMT